MNKEQYLKQRNDLVAKAEGFIAENKLDEAEAVMQEVKDLDNKWEGIKLATANLNALKDNHTTTDLTTVSVEPQNAIPVTKIEPTNVLSEQKAYENAWAKQMMGQSLTQDEQTVFENMNSKFKNTLQTTTQHAVLIPETVASGIWQEAADLYPIINDLNLTDVPGDLTIIKEVNGGADASWYDEDTVVADSEFALGTLNLTGCELAKSIPVSWKLRKMSIKSFIAYITSKLSEKMGAALANGVVNGKGKPGAGDSFKPEPNGIVTALNAEATKPQVVTYTAASGITYENLTAAMAKIKSAYKAGAKIYATSATIWDQLANLKDANERPIFIPDVTAGGIGRIFGLVVAEDDSVADGSVLFGNVKRGYAANVNQNMAIYTEDHIKARSTDYMAYAIIDGDVLSTKAFALLTPTV